MSIRVNTFLSVQPVVFISFREWFDPNDIFQLMVFLRVFGYFISSNVLMAISIDRSEMPLRHLTNPTNILEKVFCDRLPDCSPNVSASHSLASSRCLDPCTCLLRSTVKLVCIHCFEHIFVDHTPSIKC